MSYTCPFCGKTSYHPEDERRRYCGRCHVFEEDEMMRRELQTSKLVTDKMVEAAARKMAVIEGQDPDGRASHFHDNPIWTEYKISATAILQAALAQAEPVAWRVKDFADGWILCHSLDDANREASGAGNLIQPLYGGLQ